MMQDEQRKIQHELRMKQSWLRIWRSAGSAIPGWLSWRPRGPAFLLVATLTPHNADDDLRRCLRH